MNVPLDAVERAVRFLADVYEYVLIDCPLGLSDLNLVTVDCCDELYLVTTPDVPALRDLSRYVDRLSQVRGVALETEGRGESLQLGRRGNAGPDREGDSSTGFDHGPQQSRRS